MAGTFADGNAHFLAHGECFAGGRKNSTGRPVRAATPTRGGVTWGKSIRLQKPVPNGIVSSVSFVSTTNTARSLAGFVLLALALTAWRSPGSSEKFCPAL